MSQLPFQTVTPPNPQFATGTVGILIAPGKSSQAAGFARYARGQLSRNGKWPHMQIVVFTDKKMADVFSKYQLKRRGALLAKGDFAALAQKKIWTSVPAFVESRGRTERIDSPARAPFSWWMKR